MRRTLYRFIRLLAPLLALLGLVACGSGAPAATSSTTVSPTVSSAAVTDTTSAPIAGAASASIYVSLPQSQTPEGYYVLGEPDAPVLMEHYSDFL